MVDQKPLTKIRGNEGNIFNMMDSWELPDL